jgi:anti-sigma regulatory factor (Ser/Thr protein kinase)
VSRPHLEIVPDEGTEVLLVLPIEADWLALARTTGAAVAARADFTYDEIADLRLAIDELCLSLIERHTARGRIELRYTLTGEELRIDACLTEIGPQNDRIERIGQEFSQRILDALVDSHALLDDAPGGWFTKRRAKH